MSDYYVLTVKMYTFYNEALNQKKKAYHFIVHLKQFLDLQGLGFSLILCKTESQEGIA